jgi:S1-C subfamily serine protease
MKQLANRHIMVLAIAILLLLAACSRAEDSTPVSPIATTDSSEIAALVMEEIEAQLGDRLGENTDIPTPEPTIDPDAIAEKVLAQVEEELAQQEENVPVVLEDEVAEMTADSLETSLTELYQNTNPGVVFIIVPPIGSGSGFVFSSDGYIVTNNHVVDGGSNFEVIFANGERRRAELVGTDVDSDLAVIKVDQLPDGVPALPLGSSDDLRVGQLVVAIGNPFGEQGSMSLGIVSGLGRSLQSNRESSTGSSYSLPEVVQTDAPINPGNSGGPLLNLEGAVVGVNSAIRTTTGTNSGVGFSIPVDAVSRIVPELIANGSYDYPFVGAVFDGEISLDDQEAYDLSQTQGAYVLSITTAGPADEAGLIAADPDTGQGGDLIVAINGETINDFSDLNSYLVFRASVGDTITVTVLRAGSFLDLLLTLGARP